MEANTNLGPFCLQYRLPRYHLRKPRHARIQKVLSEGSNSDNVLFLVDEGRTEDPYNTKCRPSSAQQRNADDSPTRNASLVALCFSRGSGPLKTLYFCDFPGGTDPMHPSGSALARVLCMVRSGLSAIGLRRCQLREHTTKIANGGKIVRVC